MAASILVPSLLAFFIQKYWVSKKSFVTITGKPVGQVDLINEKHIVYPIFIVCCLLTVIIMKCFPSTLFR